MKLLQPLTLILVSIVLGTLAPWKSDSALGSSPGPHTALRWQDPGETGPTCQPPRQVSRTFVGFHDGRDLSADFEPAALEATRILKLAKAESCKLRWQQDASGTFHGALQSSGVEITAVLFRRPDLAVADVEMRPRGGRDPSWSLRVVRAPQGDWQLVGAR